MAELKEMSIVFVFVSNAWEAVKQTGLCFHFNFEAETVIVIDLFTITESL